MQENVVVIGGGFGGIAAALRARALGFNVTLVDCSSRLGGRAQVFNRGGYKHDAGPTVITAPFLFDELFSLFGKKRANYIEFRKLDLWYRFRFSDGDSFDYGGSVEDTLEEISRFSEEDKSGYLALLKESSRIYDIGFKQLADKPFHDIKQMLKLTPSMFKLGSYKTVWQLVCKHLKSDKLRQAFSIQPLLVGGNPFDTTSIYNLIHFLERKHGIHFAMGGTGALVDALSQLISEEGIKVHLNQKVSEIKLNREHQVKSVETECGQSYLCDHVISNTDPAHLYSDILPGSSVSMSARMKNKFCKKSMGLFVLFFGTTKSYPDVAHHTISLGPRYKGLLDDIFNKKKLAEDFSLYLHRPTATDPSFAPKGRDSFYALVPVPNLQGGQDWSKIGQDFQRRVIDNLSETLLPGLKDCIDHPFFMTPKDFEKQYHSPFGSGFSIAPLFTQSAWFRYHNKAEGPKNLYLVGAGTHPGAGLPGVISSAKVVEHLLRGVPQESIEVQEKQEYELGA